MKGGAPARIRFPTASGARAALFLIRFCYAECEIARAAAELSTIANAPIYREELPKGCPVAEQTGPLTPQRLLRLVGPTEVTNDDFHSHAFHGPCTFPGRECDWAACSMYLDGTAQATLLGLRKFPKLKQKNAVAIVRVDPMTGVARIDENQHVAVWMYASFDPVANLADVVPLEDYRGANDRA